MDGARVQGSPGRLAGLSDERQELLLARLSRRATSGPEAMTKPPRTRAARFPLSPGQEELYFLHRFAPESGSYNLPVVRRVTGPLDHAVLSRALQRLTERHEGLRTRLAEQDGQAMQVIEPTVQVPLPVIALSEEESSGPGLLARIRGVCARPFDLAVAPLLRCTVFATGPDAHVLVLNAHHIISDGWSSEVLWRDLAELYRSELTGLAPRLPDLSIQYVDFVAWQRDMLTGPRLDRLTDYWRRRLRNLATLNLPTDRPRSTLPTFRGAVLTCSIPATTVRAVHVLARREQATDFMAFLATFTVLLHQYSGQTDIPVGTITSGRNGAGLSDIVGYFARTLVLRTDLGDDPTFLELLRRVRRNTLDDFAHDRLPFSELVRIAGPRNDVSRSPLFQVMVTYVPGTSELSSAGEICGTASTPVLTDFEVARYDLVLNLVQHGDLSCVFEYNTDLFDKATVEQMAQKFLAVLDAVIANPQEHVSRVASTGATG